MNINEWTMYIQFEYFTTTPQYQAYSVGGFSYPGFGS